MTPLSVLSVTSEIYPLVKTGGLADVTGALPPALAREDVAVRTLIPGYRTVMSAIDSAQPVHAMADLFGGPARVLEARVGDLALWVLDAPHLYGRAGNPYVGFDGQDWPDNPIRFAALATVAADIGGGVLPGYRPDVVHAHDWQAGLTPAYLHYRTEAGTARPATMMTVHNLAFQGNAPADMLGVLGLPPQSYGIDGVEYYGTISFLKAGLQFADRITTVSPTYAAEVLEPEMGMGFDGLLRARAAVLSGILNGIDTAVWNPATDSLIATKFNARALAKRTANKTALQARMGLPKNKTAPLFGVVSRLTDQKGMDLLLGCLPVLRSLGAQLALIGSGDPEIEAAFRAQAAATPDSVGCVIGFDESLAHRMQAGVDALLVPSRFEPCGLTQLCALRYGAVPVVARVGGLVDTVVDATPKALTDGVATGVQFGPVTATMLDAALRRTVELYRDTITWRRMQRRGMTTDVSWQGPARHYAALYRELVAART